MKTDAKVEIAYHFPDEPDADFTDALFSSASTAKITRRSGASTTSPTAPGVICAHSSIPPSTICD
jgi:hypothetical protein